MGIKKFPSEGGVHVPPSTAPPPPPPPPPPIGMSVSATGLVLMRDFVDDCRVVFGSSLLGPVA